MTNRENNYLIIWHIVRIMVGAPFFVGMLWADPNVITPGRPGSETRGWWQRSHYGACRPPYNNSSFLSSCGMSRSEYCCTRPARWWNRKRGGGRQWSHYGAHRLPYCKSFFLCRNATSRSACYHTRPARWWSRRGWRRHCPSYISYQHYWAHYPPYCKSSFLCRNATSRYEYYRTRPARWWSKKGAITTLCRGSRTRRTSVRYMISWTHYWTLQHSQAGRPVRYAILQTWLFWLGKNFTKKFARPFTWGSFSR